MRAILSLLGLVAALSDVAIASASSVGASETFAYFARRAVVLPTERSRAGASEFAQGWQDYSPEEREEALKNYERHRRAPPQRRREIERDYERWQQMPEPDRRRIRENYERYRRLPQDQRRQFNRNFRRWKEERAR